MNITASTFLQILERPPTVLTFIVSFAAFITAVGVIWKAPPFRKPAAFICRRLIGEPVTEWFRGLLREEATQVIQTELKQPNGGSSIPDLAAQLETMHNAQTELSTYTHTGIHAIRNALVPINAKLDVLWGHAGLPPLEEGP